MKNQETRMKRNEYSIKKILACTFILIVSSVLFTGCGDQVTDSAYTVRYAGKKYVSLEYPVNVFYYDYNGNSHDNFLEVDGQYPIDSPNWDMIWNGGDLYCSKKHIEDANSYYADDDNYSWYVLIDSDDYDEELNSYPIEVTDSEIEAVYGVEEQKRDLAVFFDEFEKFGSLFKISKDGVVRGTISIGKYDDQWYWRSEIIDESREKDDTWPEYVQALPKSLDNKINEVYF